MLSRWPRNVRQWYCWLVSISDVFWTHTSARVCCNTHTHTHTQTNTQREYKCTFEKLKQHYSCSFPPICSGSCIDTNATFRRGGRRERTLFPTNLIPRIIGTNALVCCSGLNPAYRLRDNVMVHYWFCFQKEKQCSLIMQSVLQQHTHTHTHTHARTHARTLLDLMPAPAPSFWSRMVSMSITMNSSSCRGLHRLLKGLRQYVFPSTSATSELEMIYWRLLVTRADSQKHQHKTVSSHIYLIVKDS